MKTVAIDSFYNEDGLLTHHLFDRTGLEPDDGKWGTLFATLHGVYISEVADYLKNLGLTVDFESAVDYGIAGDSGTLTLAHESTD